MVLIYVHTLLTIRVNFTKNSVNAGTLIPLVINELQSSIIVFSKVFKGQKFVNDLKLRKI
jgi:hypothetical protein